MPDRDIGSIVEACTRGNGDISEIEAAVAEGANVNANINAASNSATDLKRFEDYRLAHGTTVPLVFAIQEKRADIVCALLRLKANPNAPDSKGVSPLHAAIFDGTTEIVQSLIDSNADVDRRDRHGQTPLFFAPSRKVCGQLELAKCDVNVLNEKGQSALHLAAHAGLNDTVLWLLERMEKETINAQDRHGRTAVYCAAHSNLKSTILLLQENGADVRLRPYKYPQMKARRSAEDANRKRVIEDTSNAVNSVQKARDRFGGNLSVDTSTEAKSKEDVEIISPKIPLHQLRHLQDEMNEADPEVLDELAKQLEEREAIIPLAVDDFNACTSEEKGWISRPPLTAVGPFSFPIRPFGEYYTANVTPNVEGFLQVLYKRNFPDARGRAFEVVPKPAVEAPQAEDAKSDVVCTRAQADEAFDRYREDLLAVSSADRTKIEEAKLEAARKEAEDANPVVVCTRAQADEARFREEADRIKIEEAKLEAARKEAEDAVVAAYANAQADEARYREEAERTKIEEAKLEAARKEAEARFREEQERIKNEEAKLKAARKEAEDARIAAYAKAQANEARFKEEADRIKIKEAKLAAARKEAEDAHNAALARAKAEEARMREEAENRRIAEAKAAAARKEAEDAQIAAYAKAQADEARFREEAERRKIEEAKAVAACKEAEDAKMAAYAQAQADVVRCREEAERRKIEEAKAVAARKEAEEAQAAAYARAQAVEANFREEAQRRKIEEAKAVAARKEVEEARLVAYTKAQADVARFREEAERRKIEEAKAIAARKEAEGFTIGVSNVSMSADEDLDEVLARTEKELQARREAEARASEIKAAAAKAAEEVAKAERERVAAAKQEEKRLAKQKQEEAEKRRLFEKAALEEQQRLEKQRQDVLREQQRLAIEQQQHQQQADELAIGVSMSVDEDFGQIPARTEKEQQQVDSVAEEKLRAQESKALATQSAEADLAEEKRRAAEGMAVAMREEANLKAQDEANAAREMRLAIEEKALALKAEEEARAQDLAAEQTSPVKSPVMQKIMAKEGTAQKDQEDAVVKIQRIQRGRADRLRVEKKRNAIPVGSVDFEGASVWEVPLRKVNQSQKYGFSHTNAKVELLREYTKAFITGVARLDESSIQLDQTLLSDEEYPEALIVKKISDRGLMGEWNFVHPEAEVKPGDRIIGVNGAKTITEMQKQLRNSECVCKVLRCPEVFHIVLDKSPERRFGFKFEKPAVKSLRELKITEIMKEGLLDEANRLNMRRGHHHQVVLPGMRIEATDEVEGDCFQIAEALRQCNKPIVLRVRRAGFFQLAQDKVAKKARVISAMQLGTGKKIDVPLQSASVYSIPDPISQSASFQSIPDPISQSVSA